MSKFKFATVGAAVQHYYELGYEPSESDCDDTRYMVRDDNDPMTRAWVTIWPRAEGGYWAEEY